MTALLRDLDELPQQNATHVKNKWGDVVRQVQQEGSVAITNHSKVEMVLVTANVYRQLTSLMSEVKERERQQQLDELKKRFDQRLAGLKRPDFADTVDRVLAARGKLENPPKAGETY